MKLYRKFKRYGMVFQGRPWRVEVKEKNPTVVRDTVQFSFVEEVDADKFILNEKEKEEIAALGDARVALLADGHVAASCDLIGLQGDPEAVCSCHRSGHENYPKYS